MDLSESTFEGAPVLDRPAPLRRLHDSGTRHKYPDLLTYLLHRHQSRDPVSASLFSSHLRRKFGPMTSYDTIRYDSGYLTCSKKLTGSQLTLPHGTNKKLECETKNKMMSIIGPVQSRYREAVQ